MKLKIYLITTLIALLLSAGAWFIDVKIAFGILFSAAYSMFNMLVLSLTMKAAIGSKQLNYTVLIPGNIIRFALLMVVIYIAVKNPQIFHMVGVAVGFTLFLVALLADALSRKGRKTE